MRPARRILTAAALPVVLGLLAATLAAGPAQAANSLCNSNTTTGEIIGSYTPSGSNLTRYVSAKICVAWDTNSVRNTSSVHCRTSTGGTCDIRAEVLQGKLDHYWPDDGSFAGTLANNWFQASNPGYNPDWAWLGSDVTGLGDLLCFWTYQSNDFDIRVRFGAEPNHPLHNFGDHFSVKGQIC